MSDQTAYGRFIDFVAQVLSNRKGEKWSRLQPSRKASYREDAECIMRILFGDGLLADDFYQRVEKIYIDPSTRPPGDLTDIGRDLHMLRHIGGDIPGLRVVKSESDKNENE